MLEFEVKDLATLKKIVGQLDINLKHIEERLDVKLKLDGESIKIEGEKADIAKNVLTTIERATKSSELDLNDLDYIIVLAKEHRENELIDLHEKPIAFTSSGRSLFPKTIGQKRYVDSISKNDIVFGTGPAGTGKTYIAIALACNAFRNKQFEKIILTRPAVEAGENLGFLPGDLQEKIDPYLRPVYDALYEILGAEKFQKCLEKGQIEIAPLAYMRGRTLDRSFIVLDEAQNTTHEQMKMFLTRLGYSSKMVITGDLTQTDLPHGKESGLKNAINLLRGVKGIGIEELKAVDIVRHPLVKKIIEKYDQEKKNEQLRYEQRKKDRASKYDQGQNEELL